MRKTFFLAAGLSLNALNSQAHAQATGYKLDFGPGKVESGYTQVLPDMIYSPDRGFGFEPGAVVKGIDRGGTGLITSDKPFQFSVKVPEGSYQVTLTLGDPQGESETTVKAELRRLFVEKAHLASGQTQSYTFNVNVRTPQIRGGGEVKLKPREKQNEAKAWDDKLTLEFDDQKPCVRTIEIHQVNNLPVVYVCGDSTVCDQPGENFASWGQMLTRFFKPDVVIANHAESGESLRDFINEKRWPKVLSTMKAGDYMIVQMGHNDEKDKAPGAGAMTSYKTFLKQFVADTRAKGATPIIVSPMERRNFKDGKITPSHGEYPDAVRQVAREDHVAFIDLTNLSVTLWETLGPEKAALAFAGSGDRRDTTHQDNYGAYELAKCIAQGIKDNNLDLAKSIVDDFKGFDPAKPDNVDTFTMPTGPSRVTATPLGS
jgi:lysophospholipase L1-like esterase